MHQRAISKTDPNRFDTIVEVEKFNPYHDAKGRFASGNSYAFMTYQTKDPSKQHMADKFVAREKERARIGTSYERVSFSVLIGRGTKEENKKKNETIKRFMNEAKIGDVYSMGAGVGSAGSSFEIVHHGRSPNKMGIRSSGSNRTVAMSRENVLEYIKNGATLVSQKPQS